MRTLLRGLAMAGLLILLLLLIRRGLGVPSADSDPSPKVVESSHEAPTTLPPPAERPSATARAEGGAPAADGTLPSSAAGTAYARRLREDWCGFGAVESWRDAQQERDEHSPGARSPSQQTREQLMKEAQAQVIQGWQHALRRRGEPRALALAEFIAASQTEDLTLNRASRARLQAMALVSSDPMLTALALQKPCDAGQCRNVEGTQWSRLEPENLNAWLQLFDDPQLRPSQGDYLMERMASQAKFSRSYARETGEMLSQLIQTETPGWMHEAETMLLSQLAGTWLPPALGPLLQRCRELHPSVVVARPADARACEAIADALWAEGDLLERRMALALAGAVLSPAQAQRARWEDRAREAEAVQVLDDERIDRALNDLMALNEGPAALCQRVLPSLRATALDAARRMNWQLALAQLQQAGQDRAALSRRWRDKNGRSMLEPVPQRTAP